MNACFMINWYTDLEYLHLLLLQSLQMIYHNITNWQLNEDILRKQHLAMIPPAYCTCIIVVSRCYTLSVIRFYHIRLICTLVLRLILHVMSPYQSPAFIKLLFCLACVCTFIRVIKSSTSDYLSHRKLNTQRDETRTARFLYDF